MSDLVRTAEWWEQTFGGTETNYVTAERDGETWYFRRFTQNPAAARITELETALAEAGEQLRTNAETLVQVPAAIAEARRQALEEAAKVADAMSPNLSEGTLEMHPDLEGYQEACANIAQAIRALASDPLLDRQGNGKEG